MPSEISQSANWPQASEDNNKDKVPSAQEIQRALSKSKEIENWLVEENKAFERRRKGIKILLLGEHLFFISTVPRT